MSCPDPETLAAVETLGEGERSAVVDHAATCDSCRPIVMAILDAVAETAAPGTHATGGAAPARAPGMPPVIDRYRIDRELGAGAMGVVYAAYDPELARPVAVKVLRAGGSRDRMRREAQALARLTHPNVVAVHDVGDHDGATFVTMALVDGENLRTWLRGERTTAQIVDAIVQAARGVEAAHRAGIVHRDIKPDNIFVARSGGVLVGDFGLARSGDTADEASVDRSAPVVDLTRTGSIVGTPAYMAPEQLAGEATAASDQFALCVTAWEALYRSRPFTGKTFDEIALAVTRGPPEAPRTRSVPAEIHAAIARGLAADPAARHPSLSSLIDALTPPKRRRRWPLIAAAVAIAGGGAAIAVIASRGDDAPAEVSGCDKQGVPPVWSSKRRADFLARIAPPAAKPALAQEIEIVVGNYAGTWSKLARAACIGHARHTLSEPAYEATTWCLARRAATLERTLGTRDLDPQAIARLVEALEPLETCQTATAPMPSNNDHGQLLGTLDLASVLVQTVPSQVPDPAVLVRDAIAIGDAAAIAEASYLEGVVSYARGRDAALALRRAIAHAEKAGDDRIRTRAAAVLAAAAARGGRLAEAVTYRDLAVSAAARASDPITAIAVQRAQVALAFAREDAATELTALRAIETIQIERFGDPAIGLVDTRFQIAGVLRRTNAPDAAAAFDRARATLVELVDEKPLVALQRLASQAPFGPRRVELAEQIVELTRRDDPAGLAVAIRSLAYDYELVGDYQRSLATAIAGLDVPGADDATRNELLESAAAMAFEVADQTDDKALRASRIADAHGFLDRIPAPASDAESVRSIRGRTLVLEGRYADAVPHLTAVLAAAERAEQPHPYRIALRAFALAQALWESGGKRDRDRALALAEQAAARMPEARAIFDAAPDQYAAVLVRFERHAAQLDAWRRTHR
jgi:predicted Ser/Thr protein kinase